MGMQPASVRTSQNGSLQIRKLTLGAALIKAAESWGDQIGWVFDDCPVSFSGMLKKAQNTASSLKKLGIGKGDTVAVLAPNLPEYGYLLFGAAIIGAKVLPMNTRAKTFEIEHYLLHGEASVLFTVSRFLGQDYVQYLEELLGPGAISDIGKVQSHVAPDLQWIVGLGPDKIGVEFSSFLEIGDREQAGPVESDWTIPALLQYTSGTTSRPKGALLNHRMVLNYGVSIASRLGVAQGEPFLSTQPFYHVGGSCATLPLPLTIGCKVVIPNYYDPARVLSLIEREKCVARSGFYSMYLMESEVRSTKQYDTSSLRAGWYAGPPHLLPSIIEETGIPVMVQGYGATEGGGAWGSLEDPVETRLQSCGRSLNGMEIGIFDQETGNRLAAGERGEIAVRGWMQMNGYFKQPDETRKVMRDDGWLRMGDLGYLDEGGYLHFVGRIKNMIRVGGENASAEEIESVLLTHPDIKMAAVIAVSDPKLEEVAMAIIEIDKSGTPNEDSIIEFCKQRLANFRVPRHVRFVKEWPVNGSGKIDLSALRKLYAF